MLNLEQIIKFFNLKPLPLEGGLYRQTYKSDEVITKSALPARYSSDRVFGVAIYYLLTSDSDSFSALHCLLTEEIWHFYLGDPVEMLLLYPEGRSRIIKLGQDVLNGQHVQFVVPRYVWQGARLITGGCFAFMGTTMAPGYDYKDVTFGKSDQLIKHYPDQATIIKCLTRDE